MPPKREVTPVLPWTGITVGHWATCSCTWGYRDGKPEIKYVHAICVVHHGGAGRD